MVIYVRDPYMLFHKKWFNKKQIHSNMRIQNYGLIKYGDFDSIILGTSMMENTSAKEASEKLNSNFANLSFSAATFYERFKILKMPSWNKQLNHIIFSFDYRFTQSKEINNTFYPDLYNDTINGKFNAYMTTKAIKCIFFNRKCNMIDYNLNRPSAWYMNENFDRRFGGFENWIKYHKNDNQIQEAFRDLLNTQDNYKTEYKEYKQIIDSEILPILNNSQTKYSIIIPPYSMLWWAKRKNHLDKYFEAYAYIIEKTANMPNVKIYWFYDEDIVNNISQYKDLAHYHHTHNSEQIDAIKNGTNIIDYKNYRNKLNDFKKSIYKFDLNKYINKIPREYLSN